PPKIMNSTFIAGDDFRFWHWEWAAQLNLPAVIILLLCTIVLVIGIRESARTNATLVAIKVGVVLLVIGVGVWYISTDNWTGVPMEAARAAAGAKEHWGLLGTLGVDNWLGPYNEKSRSPFMPYGFSGVMVGAALVFFAYIGFDAISTHAEEAKRPQRDVPIGI